MGSATAALAAMAALIAMIPGCAPESRADGFRDPSAAHRSSTPTHEHEADVATAWYDLLLKLLADEKLPPPVAARALAYTGVALYESVVPGMPTHRSLVGQLGGFHVVPAAPADEAHHWPTAANSALAAVMRSLFALGRGSSMRIAELESGLAHHFQQSVDVGTSARSSAFGGAVGSAVARWSTQDGYARFHNCGYRAPVGPGLWTPTSPLFSPPQQPCWGRLRPFVLGGALEFDPGPPPVYSEDPRSAFFRDAKEVYDVSNNLTGERRAIAPFWGDGPGTVTPAGHTAAILRRLTWERGVKLDLAAEAYAKVGLAAADAFINCWAAKYRYNVLRPVTYIRNVIDPTWTPLITTPPFPEYTSGHSTVSGATMQVLTDVFGRDFAFTDHTQASLGLGPRGYTSFWQAAEEAAISRLYGGIHYRTAIERGLVIGRQIGDRVNALAFRR